MKKFLLLVTFLVASTSMALAAPPAPPPGVPMPKVLIINRQAILQFSKVGQDISRQVQGFANEAKADMSAQSKALQAEGQALQQQIAILAPDAKQKKIDAFQAKEAGLQAAAQRREAEIQGGLIDAQHSVEHVLEPILQSLMQQRGANIILDANSVVFTNSGAFDITQAAIDQLNQKMSTLKVTLQMPPQGTAPPAPAR